MNVLNSTKLTKVTITSTDHTLEFTCTIYSR